MSNGIWNQGKINAKGVMTFKGIHNIPSLYFEELKKLRFTSSVKVLTLRDFEYHRVKLFKVTKYKFIKCIFDEDFELSLNETVHVDFIFEQCTFENFICEGNGDLDVEFIFKRQCTFKSCEFINETGVFKKQIYMDGSIFKIDLSFNGNFDDRIWLRNLDFTDKYNLEFMMNTTNHRGKYENIVIENINGKLNKLDFTNINIDKLSIENIQNLNELELRNVSFNNKSKCTIQNINIIKNFKLTNVDFLEESKILFENIKCKNLDMENISQDAKQIQLYYIKVLEEFTLERVDFKNTYFNDFDISKARKKISKTSFIDAHLNDIKWGDISTINANQSTFRQLKFVNDSQGNYIEANDFYVMEMKKYKQSLKDKKGFLQEKFIFLLSEKISNFGQNWMIPLALIFLSNILFYYIARIHQFCILKIEDLKCTIDSFVIFVGFKLPKEEFCGVLEWWLINKIVVGILFYYLIIALKRKTKR